MAAYTTSDYANLVGIVTGSFTILTALYISIRKIARVFINYFVLAKATKSLAAHYSAEEIEIATKYFIRTKCQNIPPSNYYEPIEADSNVVKQDTIDFFTRKVFRSKTEGNKYYIILADSGMGKTTFLINLFIEYEKVKRFQATTYRTILLPLADKQIDKRIKEIKNKFNTIILLDAFDEDTRAFGNYQERLEQIITLTRDFRKVIITCRTQFFPSQVQEPNETGIMKFGPEKGHHSFQKFYLSPFDDVDIKKYLGKKFSFSQYREKSIARKIINKSPNLMVRPMLLSYIDLLVDRKIPYDYTFEIYSELVSKWIEREASIKPPNEKASYQIELRKFSRAIALFIYDKLRETQALTVEARTIEQFSKECNIQLSSLDIKSRSLLNRNSDGQYKFSHKSIFEYFIALEASENSEFNSRLSFEGMDIAKTFYNEMMFTKGRNYYADLLQKDIIAEMRNPQADHVVTLKFKEVEKGFFRARSHNFPFLQISGIEQFEIFENLEWLNLSNNLIRKVPRLHLSKLEMLDLSNNNITEVANLFLPKLKTLNLSYTKIVDWKFLASVSKLERLYLEGYVFTDSEFEYFYSTLPNCEIFVDKSLNHSERPYYEIYMKRKPMYKPSLRD